MSEKEGCTLVLATGYHARARSLWEGRVDTGNLRLRVIPLRNDGERHQRFLNGEFDAAEFSLALYLALKGHRAPLAAIPVFPNRRFRHSFIFVRGDSPMREAKDLRGQAVGVPSYINTCGLWVRGFLKDEYGISAQDVLWKAARKEPVEFTPPEGIRVEIFQGKGDLRSRLLNKEVEALVSPDIVLGDGVRRLLSQTKNTEKDYYRKTGIFPLNHAVVIRQRILEEHPWVPQRLFDAWNEAKKIALEDDEDPTYFNFAWIRDLWEEERALLGDDPWRYGIRGNEKILDTLIRYALEQGIIKEKVGVASLFLPVKE